VSYSYTSYALLLNKFAISYGRNYEARTSNLGIFYRCNVKESFTFIKNLLTLSYNLVVIKFTYLMIQTKKLKAA